MSYAPRRPSISKRHRQALWERDGGICYLCGLIIQPGAPFDVDHVVAREMGGSDSDENLRIAHPPCHRQKSKADVKAIAKSNRIRRERGPVELRRKRKPIPQPAQTIWPSRPMRTRKK